MPWRHVAVPSWCKCGKCCKTAKEDDNVCCGKCGNSCKTTKEDDNVCCGVHHGQCRGDEFKEEYFKSLTESALAESDEGKSLPELRRSYYKIAATKFLKTKQYAVLPSCIVWTIRRQFEEKNGKYTGFPPKDELLQKVVDAHNSFRGDMNVYNSVVDVVNPVGGLFTTLQKLSKEQREAVYEIFHETGTSAECEKRVECQERWTTSTNKGIEVLPRFGFLACATAFEAVVQDTIKRCLETVFSTRKVSKDEKESWMPEFTNWLKSRIEESEFWNEKEHEEETRFWTEFLTFDVKSCETTKEKQNQNQTLLKLKKTHSWKKEIFQRLVDDPTSQKAVGLVQEMVDTTKENIIGALKWMTMDGIQETFTRLADAVEASHTNGKHKRKKKPPDISQTKKLKMRKSDVAEGSSGQSPMSSSSSMSNVSSDITDSSLSSTIPTPESSKSKLQMVTSTPVPESGRRCSSPGSSTKTAIEHLITHVVSKQLESWEIMGKRRVT